MRWGEKEEVRSQVDVTIVVKRNRIRCRKVSEVFVDRIRPRFRCWGPRIKIGETMPAYLFDMFSFSIVAANCVPGRSSALVLANMRLSWNMIKSLQSCLKCDYCTIKRRVSHYKILLQNDAADICLDCRKQRIRIHWWCSQYSLGANHHGRD